MQVYITSGEAGCKKVNDLKGIAVIVDALRASATLCLLFEKGVKEVFVVGDVEDAWKLKEKFSEAILVGERNNFKIKGFHYSNSPSEILQTDNLKYKKVIFTSTSGARRIVSCKKATKILIGTTVNASSVAKLAKNYSYLYRKPIVIIPAGIYGKENLIAEEDLISAWEIAKRIRLEIKEYPEVLTSEFFKKDTQEIFFKSKHGRELIEIGLKEDVMLCSKIDITEKVPEVSELFNIAAKLKEAPYYG